MYTCTCVSDVCFEEHADGNSHIVDDLSKSSTGTPSTNDPLNETDSVRLTEMQEILDSVTSVLQQKLMVLTTMLGKWYYPRLIDKERDAQNCKIRSTPMQIVIRKLKYLLTLEGGKLLGDDMLGTEKQLFDDIWEGIT